MERGIKDPTPLEPIPGSPECCTKTAKYTRKYRYRERTESSKALGGRMKKTLNYRFYKIKKLCEPCGNDQNDGKFQKKMDIFGFH